MTDIPYTAKHKKSEALAVLIEQIIKNPSQLEFIYASHKELFGVSPYYLEATLGCTANERKKWAKDGRLHVVGSSSFYKYGKELESPLYDRWQVEFVLTEDTIAKWRDEDAERIKANRKAGAAKAVVAAAATRKKNEKERKKFAFKYNELVNEWSSYGEKEAALLELSYWTVWQNRWAKTCQMKALHAKKYKDTYLRASAEHYHNKEEALKLIAESGMSKISFYRPASPDRIRIHFCRDHYEEVKDFFYEGYRATDIFLMNPGRYRSCKHCFLDEKPNYYSLYYIVVQLGDYRFSFHTPYDLGKTYLPPIEDLALVKHEEQEGMFRFGRGLTEDEIVTHTEKIANEKFAAALKKYQSFCP